MKKLLTLLFILISVVTFSQTIVYRSNNVITVSDARLQAQLNFYVPRYADTTAANAQIGIDSCGALIFTYDVNNYWVRKCSPKRWEEIGGGGASVNIYNSDGTLTGNRQLDGGANDLRFGNLNEFGVFAERNYLMFTDAEQGVNVYEDSISLRSYGVIILDGNSDLQKALNLSGVITPTEILGNSADNYNPDGLSTASTLRLSSDEECTITGIDATGVGDGRILILHNIANADIILESGSGSSSSSNQFEFADNVTMSTNMSVTLRYDGTSQKWRLISDVGGSASVPTLQQVFDVQSGTAIMDKNNTINASLFNFFIDNVNQGRITSPTGIVSMEAGLGVGDGQQYIAVDATSTEINIFSDNGNDRSIQMTFSRNPGEWALQSSVSLSGGHTSWMYNYPDSIVFKPSEGELYIDSLDHVPNPSTYKMMVWDSVGGKVATRLLGGLSIGASISGSSTLRVLFADGSNNLAQSAAFKFNGGELVLGEAGVTQGALRLEGSTSGSVTITTLAAAGGYTLTLPPNDGSSGEVLSTNGSGVLTWISAGGSVSWNAITDPTGTQTLSFGDGEINDWTNGSNTETFWTITNNSLTTGTGELWQTSSLTSGNLASFISTSTALAANNELLNLSMSGANGTASITATGLNVSVTNTGTTNTNIAIMATASGGTSNWAAMLDGGSNANANYFFQIKTATRFLNMGLGLSDHALFQNAHASNAAAGFRFLNRSSSDMLTISSTATTINSAQLAMDTRISGDNQLNLFYANGTTDRIGINTATPNSGIQIVGSVAYNYTAQTTTYAVLATDYVIDCNGTFTVTLPTAASITGRVYAIKNSGAGVITVATTGGQTVDGGAGPALTTLMSLTVMSTGSNWIVI